MQARTDQRFQGTIPTMTTATAQAPTRVPVLPRSPLATVGFTVAIVSFIIVFDGAFFTPSKINDVVNPGAFFIPEDKKIGDSLSHAVDVAGVTTNDTGLARDLARLEYGIYGFAVGLPLVLALVFLAPGLARMPSPFQVISTLVLMAVALLLAVLTVYLLVRQLNLDFTITASPEARVKVYAPTFWAVARALLIYLLPVLAGILVLALVEFRFGRSHTRLVNTGLALGALFLALAGAYLTPLMVRSIFNSATVVVASKAPAKLVPFGIPAAAEQLQPVGLSPEALIRLQKEFVTPEEQARLYQVSDLQARTRLFEQIAMTEFAAFRFPIFNILDDKLKAAWDQVYPADAPPLAGPTSPSYTTQYLRWAMRQGDNPLLAVLRTALLMLALVILVPFIGGLYAISTSQLAFADIEKSKGTKTGDGFAVFGIMVGMLTCITAGILLFAVVMWPFLSRAFPYSLRLVPT